ncbi:MAG: ribosome recycling factor [Acidimicrobiales bacterium]|nr:ribosome recycling factor [Acidimicrobiales bacterium]
MIELVLEEAKDRMAKAVAHARHEFGTVRTGRASSALVEKLPVSYYGTETPLQQLAGFSVPEATQLVISPYDKGSLPSIEKAIQNANLGLTPSSDGNIIRLNFPPLTEERRRELVKMVKNMAEDGRIAVRNSRRSARQELDKLAKDGDASEDDVARAEKELDALTHERESEINDAVAHKEQELLEV